MSARDQEVIRLGTREFGRVKPDMWLCHDDTGAWWLGAEGPGSFWWCEYRDHETGGSSPEAAYSSLIAKLRAESDRLRSAITGQEVAA